MNFRALTRCDFTLRLAASVCGVLLTYIAHAEPLQPRPWGPSVSDGVEIYHRDQGPRRYNPWEKFRDQTETTRQPGQKSQVAPRYRERNKPTYQERKLPQFYDGRGVPNGSYPIQAPGVGYNPYGWGGTGAPGTWGVPYQPFYPSTGFYPWGYGGW